jgi:hypothetical protein
VLEVQQRIDEGTLARPEKPLADMKVERLTRLADSPVVRVKRARFRRS